MGIGIDITEVKRIEELSLRHKEFLTRVYTPREIEFCTKKRNKYQHLAARFAAKESVLKALGTGWSGRIGWTDVEVVNDRWGKPEVNTYGRVKEIVQERRIKKILVSLSHCRDYAVACAQVITERG
ncbi:MAG: holo-ACP synthase [Proteobacteria bacterium]|nr:holo-ACP synthase [Pseudomonadota bacterium]